MKEHLTDLHHIEKLTTTAIEQVRQSFLESDKPIGVISDIDEFLVDTVDNHIQFISRAARMLGYKGTLPSYEDIIAEGGTAHYAEIFRMDPQDWETIMMRIRATRYVNRNARMYHPNPQDILSEGPHHALLGFMSAKPATESTYRTTKEDLFERLGFQEKPVILRPHMVDISQSSAWKVELLSEIVASDPSKMLVLTDDSISTAKAVTLHNQKAGRVEFMQVLYPGPLTKTVLDNGLYIPQQDEGIFVADWQTMPEIFDIINETWKKRPN